jgi:Ecdysteroid kinase-like family
MANFPAHPPELEINWLTNMMQNASILGTGRHVTGFTTTRIGDGVALLGDVVRLEFTYDDDDGLGDGGAGPDSLVFKFAHELEANRAIANNTRMYEREVTFFNDMASSINVPMPACYYANIDPETTENIVVLEDLRDYRPADQVVGVTAAEAKLIIDAFAPLQAKFWNNVEQDVLKTAMRIDTEYVTAFAPTINFTWEQGVAAFGYCIPDDIRPDIPRYVAAIPEILRMNGQRTQSVVHGDVRLDNVMIGKNADQHPVMLIDWQNVMISNPAQDLAYLLTQNMTIEERRAHEDDLVEHYCRRLQEHGVTGYSVEQCWKDHDVAALFLFAYPIVIAGIYDGSTERGRLLAEGVLTRCAQAVSDRKLFDLLP